MLKHTNTHTHTITDAASDVHVYNTMPYMLLEMQVL